MPAPLPMRPCSLVASSWKAAGALAPHALEPWAGDKRGNARISIKYYIFAFTCAKEYADPVNTDSSPHIGALEKQ